MSLILIVPEDGSIEQQELQYLSVKKGSNINLELKFYKDRYKIYPWNLANPVQFNIRAKELKADAMAYIINKDKSNSAIDLSIANTGEVNVVLNSTDTTPVINGDMTTFTGQANDKLKVTIDDIEYDDIDISACTNLTMVAAAINAAVGSVVASVGTYYFGVDVLRITSLTAGGDSNVTIADGTNSGQTVVGEIFNKVDRTATGTWGDLSRAMSLYVEIEFQPNASSRVYKCADIILDIVESVE